ncbi:MAG TPA: YidC/Oxa1 family insertase periplasmic-domain containing protein [Planctomycetota bacterium]
MDKRLPLFLFLSFLILFGWQLLFPAPPSPEAPPAVAPAGAGAETADEPALSAPVPPAAPALAAASEEELELFVGGAGEAGTPGRRGAYRAVFSNRGARLVTLELADYFHTLGNDEAARRQPANWLTLLARVESDDPRAGALLLAPGPSAQPLVPGGLAQALWQMERLAEPAVGVRFRYAPPGGAVVFEKRVEFEPGTWHLRLTLALENVSGGAARALGFTLVPAATLPAEFGDQFYAEPTAVAIGRASKNADYRSAHMAAPRLDEEGVLEAPSPLSVVGVHNKYFAFLLREANELGTLSGAGYFPLRDRLAPERALVGAEATLSLALPAQGERRAWEYLVYAGPKDADDFIADAPAHELVLDDDITGGIGRFFQVDHIAKGLLAVLRLFHGWVGNWGVAIILLTLCVRAVLFPLNRRAQTAMARYQKKMKRVQPRLEEAKKRFEGEPQKLREAQARIMQEEGAFPPLGGCLPIFLQMPIFFGLFSALRVSFDLRQAPFAGWIVDLSRPDRLLRLGLDLPLLPSLEYLNVLPILMVVLWVLQQLGMPKPADEQAARMQKMMMFMPVLFGFMLYNYAAGLSLYMITTSGCSIVEQKVIKKLWPIDDTEVAPKAKPGCGPFGGMMQHLAEKQREQMKRVQAMEAERRRKESRSGKRR